MGYFSESGPVSALGNCGSSCSCRPCKTSGGLSEYYYEGEGRDPPRRRASALSGFGEAPAGNVTRDIKIVVKSYIAPIGLSAGVPYCGPLSPGTHARLRGLALATDAAMRENPRTDAKDRAYRLYTSRTFTVTCNNGTVVSVVPSPLDTDVGQECVPSTRLCLTPPPIIVSNVSAGPTSPTSFAFTWMAKGRPPTPAEVGFQAVCPRTSVYIWHRIVGRIECAGGEPRATIQLTGSRFPSHRAWVNGVLQPGALAQGTFSRLWIPTPSQPTLVY
jgi:hypothetical protein